MVGRSLNPFLGRKQFLHVVQDLARTLDPLDHVLAEGVRIRVRRRAVNEFLHLAMKPVKVAQLPVEEIQGFGGGQSSLRYGGEVRRRPEPVSRHAS